MKKTLKNILGCLVTLVLTIVLVQYMGLRLSPTVIYDCFDRIDSFHSLKKNSLDVIVYGSSHAFRGFDTRVLNDKYDISAFNYANKGQAINTTLLFLDDSLKTQTPKLAIIETYKIDDIFKDRNFDYQAYYTKKIPFSEEKLKFLRTYFGTNIESDYASYLFPLIMFHENWSTISYENYNDLGYERYVETYGFAPSDDVEKHTIPDNYEDFEQYELNSDVVAVLDKIVEECKSQDIEILFYTCPWSGEYHYGNAMTEYASQNGCAYLNLFEYLDETGLNGKTDLQDKGHLNTSGAIKVADFIGNYIVDNYDLT